MITVSARVLGRKAASRSFSVPPPAGIRTGPGAEALPLRELLAHVVREEIAAFKQRQETRALLEVLPPEEIAERAARGRIVPGGQDLRQEVDENAAVQAALQAFEDGIYLVILDGRELRCLDEEVTLQADSALTFLRLSLLAGG